MTARISRPPGINQRRHEVRPQLTETAMPASLSHSALIIGASRGVGLGLAQEYLKRGWSVVGTVRGRTALHDLADRAPTGGGRSKPSTSSNL